MACLEIIITYSCQRGKRRGRKRRDGDGRKAEKQKWKCVCVTLQSLERRKRHWGTLFTQVNSSETKGAVFY